MTIGIDFIFNFAKRNGSVSKTIEELVSILRAERCSCVICKGEKVTLCHERGVSDLLRMLKEEGVPLMGAVVADKVVGKGAAALMILGGVSQVYAEVISRPALELFDAASIPVKYGSCVPNIVNRAGTGICPVETVCMPCLTAVDCLPLIEEFVMKQNSQK